MFKGKKTFVTAFILIAAFMTAIMGPALNPAYAAGTKGDIREISKGDHIYFGSIPDGSTLKGNPYFRVLKTDGEKVLLLSEYLWSGGSTAEESGAIAFGSDTNQFSGSNAQTWCREFYDTVLGQSSFIEKSQFETSATHGAGAVSISDYVYFLTLNEALDEELFQSNGERTARTWDMENSAPGEATHWWLSSHSSTDPYNTACIDYRGSDQFRDSKSATTVEYIGGEEREYSFYARPAFMMNLSAVNCACYEDNADTGTKDWRISHDGSHHFGEWTVTTAPTATKTGEKTRTCEVCGEKEKEVIPATGQETAAPPVIISQLKTKGKTALVISWNKVKDAKGYDIYFAKCNGKDKKSSCKKIKTVKGNKTFKLKKKGLKKNTAYKAYVKAWTTKNGKKKYIASSPLVHAFTAGYRGKYTNPKSVTVNKTSVSLKKGKGYKIKAGVKLLKKGKKIMPKTHAPKLRYLSSNKKVASVSSTGKITAKSKGSCKIFVITVNGFKKSVKVTVK